TVDKLNFSCIELNIKLGKAHHFAFRGLGFSLLVTTFLWGLQLKLFPLESSWWTLPYKKF
ncbi:hypothetical protein, partial [Psychrobacillus psychrotolerans]|uniref:hypothetical protein n=1 Tax=Psychrobacillus psychrotolerans TaxID=126156 RepID=UPI003C74D198